MMLHLFRSSFRSSLSSPSRALSLTRPLALALPLLLLQLACSTEDGGTDGDPGGAPGNTPGAGGEGGNDGEGGEGGSDGTSPITVQYDFTNGAQDWTAHFADYGPDQEDILEKDSGVEPLPSELGAGTGFMIQSHNRSDDVFMFLTRKLGPADGIEPNETYILDFEIVLGSVAQENCFGIGGAPAESVYLKAGAASVEPQVSLVDDSYTLNVDKGNQSQGGPAASVAGHIGNGDECGSEELYRSVTRTHEHDTSVTADAEGELWLLVGTDSGFEGLTRLYYQEITVGLTPVE